MAKPTTSIRENRMKMSEVFKLPLSWKRYLEKNELRIKIQIFDKSEEKLKGFFYNMGDDEVKAIIEAVNSHDTQLADMDRVLEAMKKIEGYASGGSADKVVLYAILGGIKDLAHQTYTELREKYPRRTK